MRHRVLALSFLVVSLVTVFALSQGAPAAQAQGTVPGDRQARFEYPGADNLYILQQWCLPDGTVGIQIQWTNYNLGTQFVDISHSNNGWIFGTFVGIGPFAPWENSLTPWFGIRSGAVTYVRVNMFNGLTWYPSQTIQFTTGFCTPQVVDSDGDGIPNNVDACPFQYGPAFYNGCPTTSPPPSGGTGFCDPVTGWCPGQPAPQSRCPSVPQILIFPAAAAGCVWPTRGNGATYLSTEDLIVCYWVNQPMNVKLEVLLPNGTISMILQPGYDDGRGSCFNPLGVIVPPAGERTIRLFTGPAFNQLIATSTYNVQ